MDEQRNLEAERQELLKQIDAALSDEVRRVLQTPLQQPLAPKVTVSKNEVGSAYEAEEKYNNEEGEEG